MPTAILKLVLTGSLFVFFPQNLTNAFEGYKSDEDVTLHCQGKSLVKTNKIALFFSSKLFQKIFETNCDCNTNLLQEYDIICPGTSKSKFALILLTKN